MSESTTTARGRHRAVSGWGGGVDIRRMYDRDRPVFLVYGEGYVSARDKISLNTSGAEVRLGEQDLLAAILERALRDVQFIEDEVKMKGYSAFKHLMAASDWFFCLDNGQPFTALYVLRNLPDIEDPEGTLEHIRQRIIREWDSERIRRLFL